MASGTMGNLVSEMAHVPRGGEIICGEGGHTIQHEAANHAVVVGASMRTLPWGPDGRMDLDAIRDAFRDPTDPHDPITSLVMLENTHSDSMAQPLPADYVSAVARVAHEGGVPLHVDGARLFNAAVALGTTARAMLATPTRPPSASRRASPARSARVVVGRRDFIWRARRARKLLGGGMRQVGVLAAPGLIALRDGPAGMIERLAEDHANARRLAEGLAQLPGIDGLDPARVRTNFVLFRVTPERAADAPRDGLPDSANALPRRARARGRAHGPVLGRPDPGRDPLRHRRGRHRHDPVGNPTRLAHAWPGTCARRGGGRMNDSTPKSAANGQPALENPSGTPARTDGDRRFDALVTARFTRVVADSPILATYLGIHESDGRLADLSRAAKLAEIEAEHRFLSEVEASTRPSCRSRSGSSASWPSCPPAAASSTPRSIASGSGAPRPATRSATRCSCCSRANSRRCPSASCP